MAEVESALRGNVYLGRTARMPLLHCPQCGHLVDNATSVSLSDESPRPKCGDITFCVYCAAVLMFEESLATVSGLSLRTVAPAEREALANRRPEYKDLLHVLHGCTRELVKQRRQGRGRG